MQITLDVPDDVLAKAEAVAKREQRSLGSLFSEFVRGLKPGRKEPNQEPSATSSNQADWTLPVVRGTRPFTTEDVARWEAEDDCR